MLKCKEVSEIIAADRLGELGLWKRLELRFHLLMCSHCQRYMRQIRSLGRGARDMAAHQEPTSGELQQLEDDICTKLCGHEPGSHGHAH